MNQGTDMLDVVNVGKLDEEVGIYLEVDCGDKYLEYQWFYVETLKDLKETFTLVPDGAEIKKDIRLVKNLRTNRYIIQFREHDFS